MSNTASEQQPRSDQVLRKLCLPAHIPDNLQEAFNSAWYLLDLSTSIAFCFRNASAFLDKAIRLTNELLANKEDCQRRIGNVLQEIADANNKPVEWPLSGGWCKSAHALVCEVADENCRLVWGSVYPNIWLGFDIMPSLPLTQELVVERLPRILQELDRCFGKLSRYAVAKQLHEEALATAAYRTRSGRSNKPPVATARPSDDSIAAFRLRLVSPDTQAALAERLTIELGRPISQGQVSRWLKQVDNWTRAGNILPDLTSGPRTKPQSMDPNRIDLGPRQDARTERQRAKRNTAEE
jgi:hypothetical protein